MTVVQPAVGVDIGGVLIARNDQCTDGGEDTSFFGDSWLQTPEVEGAFAGLASLREAYGDMVFLVSKAGRRTEWKTRAWLQERDLEARTGVSPWRLWFTQDRAEKARIAAVLKLTAFVDDRLDVLAAMPEVATRVLLDTVRAHEECGHQEVTQASSWEHAVSLLVRAAHQWRGSPR